MLTSDATFLGTATLANPEQLLPAAGTNLGRVRRLVGRAHDACFVANTLNAEMCVDPVIENIIE